MRYYAPSYYSSFACIGEKCTHTCCAGWEIDIDEDTLERYRAMQGPTGELIRSHIDESGETPCFRMTEENRCPFLNQEGLCNLIISEGEDVLCQICTDHPRFRNFFADSEEIGLGMCCEAAVRLILTWPEPVDLELIDDDGYDDPESEEEQELLDLRDQLISSMQSRMHPVAERVRKLIESAGIPLDPLDYEYWAEFLLTLERLDDAWAGRLEELRQNADCSEDILSSDEWELAFEQLMVYLLYRHINADDYDLCGRIAYCILIWKLVRARHGDREFDSLCELWRLYSSEIEYSDENMTAIIDELHLLYPEI
jgi:lysine-N-methylase